MARKAFWCFTVEADEEAPWRPTSEEGEPHEDRRKIFRVGIGPLELPDGNSDYPHHHGFIQCPPGETLTKGQAEAILHAKGIKFTYLHELLSKKDKYITYSWKSQSNTHTSAERAIKRSIDKINASGMKLTAKRVKTDLTLHEGASFVHKHKGVVEVTLATPELCASSRKIVVEKVNTKVNMRNYMQCVVRYQKLIRGALDNGFSTTNEAFRDSSREDQLEAVILITLLPMAMFRKRIIDKIPGLFFHGLPNCGKSFMFDQMPCYKKIATDAEGVARFKLEGDQSAFFLNDIDSGWLFKPSNQKTLKALANGEQETIKTHGDTVAIRGFVVFTSNCQPDYFDSQPTFPENADEKKKVAITKGHLQNCNSWKRRLITLEFTEPVDFDPIHVDFEDSHLEIVARQAIVLCFSRIQSDRLKELFRVYVDAIQEHWEDEELALYEEVFTSSCTEPLGSESD